MELMIGAKLRELRRARGLTQEELAEQLGISFQAISKWERAEGYPDITMLPALASCFGVTVDELLGCASPERQARYDEINRAWAQNRAAGKHEENTKLMQDALRDFPNDALLLVQLSSSLEKLGRWGESAMVQEQILRYGGDSEVRAATQFNICFTYEKLGRHALAVEQAKKLPNLYKAQENALVSLTRGRSRREAAAAALEPLQWATRLHLTALAEETGDAGYVTLAEQIIALLEQTQEMA